MHSTFYGFCNRFCLDPTELCRIVGFCVPRVGYGLALSGALLLPLVTEENAAPGSLDGPVQRVARIPHVRHRHLVDVGAWFSG